MAGMKKVSIAIPTLNRANYLRLALRSALAQTHGEIEVVVSNNASTDNTVEVLTEFSSDSRLRVLTQLETLSMAENWNACVAAATGDFFLLLSDDDILLPEAISCLLKAFDGGPMPEAEVAMAFCRGEVIDEKGVVFRTGPSYPDFEPAETTILEFFNGRRLVWPCCILYRRSDLGAGYSSEYPLANDVAKLVRITVRRGYTVFVNQVLAQYRMHRSVTNTTAVEDWHRDLNKIAEMAISELRARGRGDESLYEEIRAASRRLNTRMIPDVLNQRYGKNKLGAVRAYVSHARYFASMFGVFMLCVGFADLFAPRFAPVGRKMYRKLRGRT
jgi:glycosyltransferase involved in cell wall biosynthesis